MIHHLSIAVRNLASSAAFYDAVLIPLGYERIFEHEVADGFNEAVIAYGKPGTEDGFAIRERSSAINVPGEGFHIAFTALSREAVVDFYDAALAHGGKDNGPAGRHPEHGPDYFAAFVFDPDGYRIEAVVSS